MVCCNKLDKLSCLIPTWVVENQLHAPKVAKIVCAKWIQYCGILKVLDCDWDKHFTMLLGAMFGMQTLFCSAYHHRLTGRHIARIVLSRRPSRHLCMRELTIG